MKDVAGKVAFITGGASGLGLAMAHSFTGAGMKVAIADVEDSALEAAKQAFADTNSEVITMKVDVTDRDAMADARKQTLDAFGKVASRYEISTDCLKLSSFNKNFEPERYSDL